MIHSTAIIDPGAQLGSNVSVGPYSVIGDKVIIGDNCVIGPHVVINGPTEIGRNNKIYQFASVGEAPQDKKYADEDTRLVIGNDNVIRESCTISRGTIDDKGVTTIGDDNWLMAYVHVAHDCQVGSHTIFANSTSLAGHVVVEDWVTFGGFSLVHQFCSIGAHSFTAMNSVISKDVPPFLKVSGHMAKPFGLNSIGLKRRGFSDDTLALIRKAYKILYRSGNTFEKAIKDIEQLDGDCAEVQHFAAFLRASSRGIVR